MRNRTKSQKDCLPPSIHGNVFNSYDRSVFCFLFFRSFASLKFVQSKPDLFDALNLAVLFIDALSMFFIIIFFFRHLSTESNHGIQLLLSLKFRIQLLAIYYSILFLSLSAAHFSLPNLFV